MIKIAHLSDLHFGAEDKTALEQTAEQIHADNYALIIVSGDVTQRGKRTEFAAAAKWLNQFTQPTLIVPGNHDTPLLNLATRITTPFERFSNWFNTHTGPVHIGKVSAYGLNTARGWQARKNWAEGSVDLGMLTKLTKFADETHQSLNILCAHHPFLEPPNSPLKTLTKRGMEANYHLQESRISLFLYGHIHAPGAHLWSSKNGRYLGISAGTLSVRLRNEAPSFNSINITNETIEVLVNILGDATRQTRSLGRWNRQNLEPLDV